MSAEEVIALRKTVDNLKNIIEADRERASEAIQKARKEAIEAVEEARKKDAELETFKQDHLFQLIVESKRTTPITWLANINTVTLDHLKKEIAHEYYLLDDSSVLKLILKPKNGNMFTLNSDEELREYLRDLILANEKVITISVQTPTKPFSSWTLKEVKEHDILVSTNPPEGPGPETNDIL